jgi:hypothetical protein
VINLPANRQQDAGRRRRVVQLTRLSQWGLGGAAVLLALLIGVLCLRPVPAGAASMLTPTPGPQAMTVYAITNPGSVTLSVEQVFTETAGFNYSYWSQVPANSTVTYHVSQVAQIPSNFNGTVTLYAASPFTAQITGYDYPGTPTPTPGPGVSPTPSPSATRVPGSHQVFLPIAQNDALPPAAATPLRRN